ncbi:uncharacterized protein LOC134711164 isoform X2 [Mytilus trossulus]|uniref:uncharacterized protein LOC134711164 isoform X2 n=1 Tax=Mytilus trossulus TaxID=6551 RepID=UPI003006324C
MEYLMRILTHLVTFNFKGDGVFHGSVTTILGCKLLKSRATAARDFLPIVQPTAFRVLTKATSLLLFTFKTAAEARPMALREKFLFFGRYGQNFTELFRNVY